MKILFRTDAGTAIGFGHAMRCLALAQAAKDGGNDVRFAMSSIPRSFEKRLHAEHIDVARIDALAGSDADAGECVEIAKDTDFIVVDGYQLASAYQTSIRKSDTPLLFIDDYGHGSPYAADLILNQNSYAPRHPEWYEDRPASAQLLLGCAYTLLRREFRAYDRTHIPGTGKSVLVTMGGGDPKNATLAVMRALRQINDRNLRVTVVVGGLNPHLAALESDAGEMTVMKDVTDMPSLMARADLAIAAAGTTSYELAYMGVPMLLAVLADNQRPVAEDMVKRNAAALLGDPSAMSVEECSGAIAALLHSPQKRLLFSENGRALVDGKGAERNVSAMTDFLSSRG